MDMLIPGTDFFFPTSPCASDSVAIGMFLKRPSTRNEDALDFLTHSATVLNLLLAGSILTLLFVFGVQLLDLLPRIRRGVRQRRPVARSLKGFTESMLALFKFYRRFYRVSDHFRIGARRSNSSRKVNWIIVAFLIFAMIMSNTLTSNINTNRVRLE